MVCKHGLQGCPELLYYITLTQVCGLRCKYCQNTPDPGIQPIRLNYDLSILRRFISMDDDPIICFYGGDPLMEPELIKGIMEMFPEAKFVIQTNGLRINGLDRDLIRRFSTILVSIDGRREVTDYYRGVGVYDRVLEGVRYIRRCGFEGDLVARMAVSGHTDIYMDVRHLIELGLFDHVHWQLDVLWDYPPAQRYNDFKAWLYGNYFPGINKLLDWWLDELEDGNVLGIAPFKGILYRILTGYRLGLLPCGSGIDAFGITTDGRILACPIAPEYKFNVVGHISSSKPGNLYGSIWVDGPCLDCSYLDLCGGRCLFANKTMLWGVDGFSLVCESVKFLIDRLIDVADYVKYCLEVHGIGMEGIKYPPFLNSIEVIP